MRGSHPELSGKVGSFWSATAPSPGFPRLEEALEVDTVVCGGGIVGLTTALRLCEEGQRVAVLEALRIGGQVTGGSSAKVTTQHKLIYHDLIERRGAQCARAYAEANSAGCALVSRWTGEYGIACDLEERPAYTYASRPDQRSELEAEAEAARSLGLAAELVDRAPLPFETGPALRFPDQAQFNPSAYLVGLAQAVIARGGSIFEQSRARKIEEGQRWQAVTEHGRIEARNMVIATNMTVKSPVGMSQRTQARSHPVMAFRIDDRSLVDGMFISMDEPTHSLRIGRDGEGPLLLSLGPRFNTGQERNVASLFAELEAWTRANLAVGDLVWRWCNEDFDTPDRVPYIGEPDPEEAPGFYIATGFNAWGISNGAAAGLLISDLIAGRETVWTTLYDPARPFPEDFHQSGESQSMVEGPDAIAPGAAGVFERGDEKVGAWRDREGVLHAVSASCTHKGCTVSWNNADNTWDCPCHGSIFAADGTVLHGPARDPLKTVDL